MFVDDVMIFFDGGAVFFYVISETFDDFAGWFGLNVNSDKLELFLVGLIFQETEEMVSYEYFIGMFFISYLGLFFMYSKFSMSEYDLLLNKFVGIFSVWVVKMLSYAGSLYFLFSVINGMVMFWMFVFILFKGCVKKIEFMCAKFFWKGSIDEKVLVKVVWNTVCLLKSEGGLGLSKFVVWNKVFCLSFVWLIFVESSFLWVKWYKYYYLCNISFWVVELKNVDSVFWKSILFLRFLVEQFLKCKVNNGVTVFLWYDNWIFFGSFINLLGLIGSSDFRLFILVSVR